MPNTQRRRIILALFSKRYEYTKGTVTCLRQSTIFGYPVLLMAAQNMSIKGYQDYPSAVGVSVCTCRTNCPFTRGRCSASLFLLWYRTCVKKTCIKQLEQLHVSLYKFGAISKTWRWIQANIFQASQDLLMEGWWQCFGFELISAVGSRI